MSVYKSQRKTATVQFLVDVLELRSMTSRIVKRFPKSYRMICTNRLLDLAGDAFTNAYKANSIYVHKGMDDHDCDLRHRFIKNAIACVYALSGEITYCYNLVSDGNNYFESRRKYDEVFQKWTEMCNTTMRRLQSVEKSDNERFKKYKSNLNSDISQK